MLGTKHSDSLGKLRFLFLAGNLYPGTPAARIAEGITRNLLQVAMVKRVVQQKRK